MQTLAAAKERRRRKIKEKKSKRKHGFSWNNWYRFSLCLIPHPFSLGFFFLLVGPIRVFFFSLTCRGFPNWAFQAFQFRWLRFTIMLQLYYKKIMVKFLL